MKNLVLISFLALAISAFMACGSDVTSQQTQDTVTAAAGVVAEKTADLQNSVSDLKQEGVGEAINNVKEEIKDTKLSEAVSKGKEAIAKAVKEKAGKAASDASTIVKDKVAAAKEVVTNVEQKQKPTVQDVEINNPPRPSSSNVIDKIPTGTSTAPPKPEIKTPPANNTSGAGTDRPKPEIKRPVKKANSIHKHADWNQLLSKHVSASGKVNYKGLKGDIATLDKYLKTLADNPIANDWSRGEKMSYWINAYNAFTVKLILDNYPLQRITDLENGKPWDKKWIKLGDKTYSLNNIENDILRPTYKDARIHFAVNCAAKSCPPLLNKAWTSKNLESNFERQAKAFVNNTSYNKVSNNKIEISKIFEWYAVDFGDIVNYINKYATSKASSGTKVEYLEYDWNLNE